jgi:hypothetical protein
LQAKDLNNQACLQVVHVICGQLLSKIFVWNSVDLQNKLELYQIYYNESRSHSANDSMTPDNKFGNINPVFKTDNFRWKKHLNGIFEIPNAA